MTFVSDRAAEAIVKGEPRKPECMMEKGSTDYPDTRTDILIYEKEDALRNMREDLQTNLIAYQCCIFFNISRRTWNQACARESIASLTLSANIRLWATI